MQPREYKKNSRSELWELKRHKEIMPIASNHLGEGCKHGRHQQLEAAVCVLKQTLPPQHDCSTAYLGRRDVVDGRKKDTDGARGVVMQQI
jgi:hypothetical protein